MMNEEQHNKDAAILQELRDISNRHSPYYNNSSNSNLSGNRSTTTSDKENSVECRAQDVDKTSSLDTTDDKDDNTNTFLTQTNENRDLNQYWYSKKTIDTLCNAIREGLALVDGGSRVAFLSTPSLFFSLSPKERQQCVLFDVSSLLCYCISLTGYSHIQLPFSLFYTYHETLHHLSLINRGRLAPNISSMTTMIQQTSRRHIMVYLT